jgi:predicted nucleic acid-binding protein
MVVDTNIFIEYLRAKDKLNTILLKLPDKIEMSISSITVYELFMGVNTEKKREEIQILTGDLNLLSFNYEIATKSAEIYNDLKYKNQLIEFRDIFIGATAIVNELPILTLNRKHFERIRGIKIYDL